MEEKKELIKRVVYKFMELSKTKDTKVRVINYVLAI